MAYITPGKPGAQGTWYIKPDGSVEEIRSRAYYDRLVGSGATFVTATSEADAKSKASGNQNATPSSTGTPQNATAKSNNAPDEATWRNSTVPQLWEQYTPEALSKLPGEALWGGEGGYKGFPNDMLQTIIDANPQILGDIPADRLVGKGFWDGSGFPEEALALFVNNLESRGDYSQNEKVQAQASNLRSAIPPTATNLKPPEQNAQARPTSPSGGATAPTLSQAGPPRSQLSFLGGSSAPIPRLDEAGLQQRLGGVGSDAGALDLFRAYTNTQGGVAAAQPPAQGAQGAAFPPFDQWRAQNPGGTYDQYFAARQAAGAGETTNVSTLQDETLPPGFISIDVPVYDEEGNPKGTQTRIVSDPSYRAPANPPTFAPRPPLEAETAQANLDQIALRMQQIEQQMAQATDELARAQQAQDFNQTIAIQDRLDRLARERESMAYNQQKLQLEAELGYAASERADINTVLGGAGVTGYLEGAPTMERELAVGSAARQNLETLASLGNAAAQIQLADLQRKESGRQFDESLGFQIRQSPASAYEQAFAGRNLAAPGGLQGAQPPTTLAAAPQEAVSRIQPTGKTYLSQAQAPAAQGSTSLASAQAPLTTREAFIDNPNITSGVRGAVTAPGAEDFRLPTTAKLQNLLPSEQEQLDAGLSAAGYNPQDVREQSRRLTTVTPPPLTTSTVRRRRQTASVY